MPTAASSAPLPAPDELPKPWLNAYPPRVPTTWSYPAVALTRLLDDSARDFPEGPALQSGGMVLGWAELADRVDRFATVLARLGVAAGDRVGITVPQLPAGVIAAFAAWRLGAVVVLGSTSARADQRRLGTARVVVTDEVGADRLVEDEDALAMVSRVVVAHLRSGLPERRWSLRRRRDRGAGPRDETALVQAWDVLNADAAPIVRPTPVDPASPALSVARGDGEVVLAHRQLVAAAFQARLWVPDVRAGHERVLCLLPATTSSGVVLGVLAPVLSAACVVLPSGEGPDQVVDVIDRAGPTIMAATPQDYRRIVEHPRVGRRDLTSIRVAVSGGGPLPAGVAAEFERVTDGARLREGHGVPAAPLTHATPIYGRSMHGTIGLPVPDTVAAVVDEAGAPCPDGVVGRLVVRGPQVAAPDGADGWLPTGDLAQQSPDGVFRLAGRVTDEPGPVDEEHP